MQTMHLFAGIGGGLLADLILGHTPIIAVEWDKYCCRVLRERVTDGWFPDMQVYEGDVRVFNPSEYKGRVDCIHAGFPCQDISNAGKQAGVGEETRSGLYREVLRIADVVRPKYIFMENVSAILSNGLGTVLGDLASRGYDARWICVRASDVGANHQRDRWWLLAKLGDPTSESTDRHASGTESTYSVLGNSSDNENLAFAELLGRIHGESEIKPAEARVDAFSNISSSGEDVSNTNDTQQQGEQQPIRIIEEHTDIGSGNWWKVECNVGRLDDGDADRVGKLKGFGNAQVPLQAAVAFKILESMYEL